MGGNGSEKEREIVFFIDNEQFKTERETITVRELLLDFAKEDPTQTTLALKHGNDINKFENLDDVVQLKSGMKLVVFHNEPTTVS
jgi:hypothetical protein